ncbi:hypothetical protein [Flexithrix dorotheae]|uniref:hypothetical protein n=1 Tax=Flexithrix dorotheae TaxID=70993 RepID=UPI0003813327|nr:hypothetical protein [Flexithrix dorotheae]
MKNSIDTNPEEKLLKKVTEIHQSDLTGRNIFGLIYNFTIFWDYNPAFDYLNAQPVDSRILSLGYGPNLNL